jgi:alanine racemase
MLTRPCWVEICTQALEDNCRFLAQRAAPQAELLAVVKADAYGHGLKLCAPAAVRAGVRWLGVTSVEEGIAVRRLCPDEQVLIVSGVFPGEGPEAVRHKLIAAAWETWHLDELEDAARRLNAPPGAIPVHLEIDTGMSRQGVAPARLAALLPRFGSRSRLRLSGVMTHLFAADEADGTTTEGQLGLLAESLSHIEASGIRPEWLNVGNSAALLGEQASAIAVLAARYGMKALMRPGLALFGLVPQFYPDFIGNVPETLIAARKSLRPVLSWKTRVVAMRAIPAGAVVGYNGTFVAAESLRLALVAVGYADGLDRGLGNRFNLLVRGQRAPLVGRISMDQSVLDVTEIPDVETGDEVVIIGPQGSDAISAFDHAQACATIPWEVFTRIGSRVPRLAV